MKPNELITIVFMGDSITEGQYVAPPHRWVDIVSNNLQLEYKSASLTLITLVKGVSGETTRQGLERFPRDVQVHTPEIVTLQFGLNDANCWATDYGLPRVSEDAYRANLHEMIERARRFGAEEIILSNNHPTLRRKPMLNGKTLEEQRKRYNDIVYEVAKATQVTFCDIHADFGPLDDRSLEEHLLPYPDLLHLSKLGHQKYAAMIEPYVRRAVERVASKRGAMSK